MLRPLKAEDITVVACFYEEIRKDTVPLVHARPEIEAWMKAVLLPRGSSWVWIEDGEPVAWIDVCDGWIDQLYCARGWTGKGIGAILVKHAQALYPSGLRLYTFQINDGAIRFYRRHSFVEVERGDGSGNEEGKPDVLLEWTVHQKESSGA